MMKNEIRILIADDHPVFRQGLRQIIETDPQLKVSAEAADGEQALARLRDTPVDVAMLDLAMPIKDGFAVARAAKELRLSTPLIFLTMHKDERYLYAALDLNVQGYVLKDSAIAEIINCIRSVVAGQMRWSCLVDNSLPFNMEAFYAEVNERNNHPSSKQNLTLSHHLSADYHPGGSAGNRHDVYLRGADSQSRCGRGKCSRQDNDCGISKPGDLE